MKKFVVGIICFLITVLIILGITLFVLEVRDRKNDAIEEKIEDKKISLVMIGDNLIHSSVYSDAYVNGGYDFKPMLEEMKDIFKSFDLAFYNQESILGGSELGLSTYPRFNSPYEAGDAYIDSGFNLVSLANNHSLDRGEEAINNSLNYWKSKDVYYSGMNSSYEERDNIKILEKNGITYALLSYTCWTNGLTVPYQKDYLLNIYSDDLAKKHIESIRDKVDVIMVSMHWGEEYSHTPSYEQREIASFLSSLGVDIIIGHHPHVVQPIEFIDNTLVIYSLGNFLSAQRGIEKLTGLMVSLDIVKDVNTNKISLNNISSELTYTYSNELKGYRGNYKVYPYTKLTNDILPNYEVYYNKYMDIVVHGDNRIGKSDYSGNIK